MRKPPLPPLCSICGFEHQIETLYMIIGWLFVIHFVVFTISSVTGEYVIETGFYTKEGTFLPSALLLPKLAVSFLSIISAAVYLLQGSKIWAPTRLAVFENQYNLFTWIDYMVSISVLTILLIGIAGERSSLTMMEIAGCKICMVSLCAEQFDRADASHVTYFSFSMGVLAFLFTFLHLVILLGTSSTTIPIAWGMFAVYVVFHLVFLGRNFKRKWDNVRTYFGPKETFSVLILTIFKLTLSYMIIFGL